MRHLFCYATLLIIASVPAWGQQASIDSRVTAACEALTKNPPKHPYLYFNANDIPAFREKLKEGHPAKLWEQILERDDIYNNAFKYLITGEQECLDKCKARIEEMIARKSWHPDGERLDHVTLENGYSLLEMAVAYDWLYQALSPDERVRLREAIVAKGCEIIYRECHDKGHWATPRANWCPDIKGPLGVAALALLGEDKRAPMWAGYAAQEVDGYLHVAVGPDGGCQEGTYYTGHGVQMSLYLLDALKRLTGVNLFDNNHLRNMIYFYLYCYQPFPNRQWTCNFEDSNSAVHGCRQNLMRLANEYDDGYYRWLYDNIVAIPHSYQAAQNEAHTFKPFEFIWWSDEVEPTPPDDLPLSRWFRDVGWVVLRSGWEGWEPLFAFKSGLDAYGHIHKDNNDFMLHAYGSVLATIVGYGYIDTVAHNVIVTNIHQYGQRGRIVDFVPGDGVDYVCGDAADSYPDLDKCLRHVVFVKPYYIVIFDEVESNGNTPAYEWQMIGSGEIDGERLRIDGEYATLNVYGLLPRNGIWQTSDMHLESWSHAERDFKVSRFSANVGKRSENFVMVLVPQPKQVPGHEELVPFDIKLTTVETENCVGVRVAREDATDIVLFSRGRAGIKAAGVESEGKVYVLSKRKDGSIERELEVLPPKAQAVIPE